MTATRAPDLTVSAWAGSTNLGDELVLAALLAKLRARGLGALVLSVDPAGTEADHSTDAISVRRLLRHPAGRPPATILGGGGLLQDETSAFNVPFHLARTLTASLPRRSFAGVGLGVGPLHGAGARLAVRTVMRRAVAVSVRDAASRDLLATLGVPARLGADLAVSLPDPRAAVEGRLGVSLRPWTGTRSRLPVSVRHRGRRASTPPWFLDGVASSLDQASRSTGLPVHFVALQPDRDDVVHRSVADRMREPVTFATPDVRTVVDELAACQAVVAMRYHAAISALLGGRPAVLIGYSPKVPSLALEVPGGMAGLSWEPEGMASLPATLAAVLGKGEVVVECRERLRQRERTNDEVIDALLEASDA